MSYLRRPCSYTILEKEDPEELKHRKAQFLIYKTLNRFDHPRRRSFLRLRICGLKVKRLKIRLRRTVRLVVFGAKVGVVRRFVEVLKLCRGSICDGSEAR
ncbi:hypothetical protein QJS10_CPA01g00906 [Acorus calamus]|uniref:Uncharacterized protein n=1 Tax=Acorus calamus TaxID=4465 RepID=A0AAV9FHD1_ACOCL|nr:hypothetical protein QJS10_CPA01g00906 [Acorus calamus]